MKNILNSLTQTNNFETYYQIRCDDNLPSYLSSDMSFDLDDIEGVENVLKEINNLNYDLAIEKFNIKSCDLVNIIYIVENNYKNYQK